ncbi:MAG TPA: glycosyltransferase [Planctomycetota bacterium]|nr:glycosyltransferase [Planctomycetota bacterium]
MSEQAVQFSVLTCCYKYLQRLRVFLNAFARQDFPLDQFEVVVTNPQSPDGLREYLDTLKHAVPAMNIVRVDVPENRRRNRGWMIARAFECSQGTTVMAADCDIVVPPFFVKAMLAASNERPGNVLGVYRNLLSPETSARIIAGLIDPVAGFNELTREDRHEDSGFRGVLGYCQVVPRPAMEKTGYPEEFDHIASSDVEFVKRLGEQQGITPGFVTGMRVLHLWHPRNWEGTEEFL